MNSSSSVGWNHLTTEIPGVVESGFAISGGKHTVPKTKTLYTSMSVVVYINRRTVPEVDETV